MRLRAALERALDDTLSMDGTARKAAQAHLEDLALTPATFAPLLLSLVRDQGRGSDTGSSYQRSLSAALALKNVVKKRWTRTPAPAPAPANKQTASNDEEEQDAAVRWRRRRRRRR